MPIKFGAQISPISPWKEASSTWLQSWTGSAALSWVGSCQTLWLPAFARMHWNVHYALASLKYSTRIRAPNSQATASLPHSLPTTSGSAWMAKAVASTTSLLNAYGEQSSMSTSIYTLTRAEVRSIKGSQNTSFSTIRKESIRLLETRLQRPSTVDGNSGQPTPEQNSSRPTGSLRSALEWVMMTYTMHLKKTFTQQPRFSLNFVHFLSRQWGPLQDVKFPQLIFHC